jgi:hypothetical protein
MAFQIGLHKEPPPNSRDRGLRRRLWWSLVVCINGFHGFSYIDLVRCGIISSLLALADRELSTSGTATCFLHP